MATPTSRFHKHVHFTHLPAELLLIIASFLDCIEEQWHLALAYPHVPQLMIPNLKHLRVSTETCNRRCGMQNITTILAFLFQHPSYVREIKKIEYHHHFCSRIGDEEHAIDCFPNGSFEPSLAPWRSSWTELDERIAMAYLAQKGGFSTDTDVYRKIGSVKGRDLELSKIAVLLALGYNVQYLHIRVHSTEWSDLARISNTALLPVLRLMSLKQYALEEICVTRCLLSEVKLAKEWTNNPTIHRIRTFDRNIATFLSTTFMLPRLKRLKLQRLTESVCYRGTWPTTNKLPHVETMVVTECHLNAKFLQRLVGSISGLRVLEIEDCNLGTRREPKEFEAFTDALCLHKDTLHDLRIVESYPHHGNFSGSILIPYDLSSLTRLKRLEISPQLVEREGHIHDSSPWHQILPSSLHNLIFNWKNLAIMRQLEVFVQELTRTNKRAFPHLAHIIDNTKVVQTRGYTLRDDLDLVHDLRLVNVEAYPNDRAWFCNIPDVNTAQQGSTIHSNWRTDWRETNWKTSPHFSCVGKCGINVHDVDNSG